MSDFLSSYRPQARLDGLITTETESDLLIYDTERNELHTLNLASAAVWRAADGSKAVAEIAAETGLELVAVEQALQLLTASNLLVNGVEAPQITGRRRLLKKAGIVAIPAIVSVSVPLSKAAASDIACGDVCVANNNECNSRCSQCRYFESSGAYQCCNPGGQHGFPCP